MPDIVFDDSGIVKFPSKYHGDLSLSKSKWDEICAEPERWYYRFNGEKVATTLVNPDYVRCHLHYGDQFLYYKRFPDLVVAEKVSVSGGLSFPAYFAVVIDASTSRVCTVYPVEKPKKGKEFKG